jgi:sugar lactone lactonase YvrE
MARQRIRNAKSLPTVMVLFTLLVLTANGCSPGEGFLQASPTTPPKISPTSARLALPDLVIREIGVDVQTNSENLCFSTQDDLFTRLTIANQGTADAGPFWVEINESRQEVPAGLTARSELTLWFPGFTSQVSARVDVTYQVAESVETNNLQMRELASPTLAPECIPTPTPQIRLQEASTVLEGHTAKVWSVAFSPDGSLVASGSVDNTLRLWQVSEGSLLRTMLGHPFPILEVSFSPDGTILATGSTDGILRLWRVSDARLLTTLQGHAGWIMSLAFSPDGLFLASSAEDFTVRVWRTSDARLVQTIDEGMSVVNDVTFAPNGQTLAWGEANGDVRIRTLSGTWLQQLKGTTSANQVAFSPDGVLLASGYADGTLRIWRAIDGENLQTMRAHIKAINGLEFSPDGKWLVTGSEDSTLRLWRISGTGVQPVPVLVYSGHNGPVNGVAFSPKGDLVASGSDDTTIRLWSVPQE